jgi:hypothetical protein
MAFLIENHSGGAFTTPAEDYYKHGGGRIKVDIYGDLGTGQVNFETSPDDGTSWIILDLETDGTPAIFTDPKSTIIEALEFGNLLRSSYSGGTAANLNVKISV